MDTNTTKEQLFEKFINKELSTSEESFLKDLAQASPELRQEMDTHNSLIQGFAALEKEHVKQHMNLWEQQIKTSSKIIEFNTEQTKKNKSNKSLVYSFLAAASIFIAFIWTGALYQSQEGTVSNSSIPTTIREAKDDVPSIKPITNSPVSEGLILLDKKDYRGALVIFDRYLILNVYDRSVNFSKGYAHYMMNDYQKALDAFRITLNAKDDFIEKQEAMYYSAQIYLKFNEKNEAIKLLNGITNPDVKHKALKVLKKIEGK
jgi:tetratricopeptide (TPR) repeat protein